MIIKNTFREQEQDCHRIFTSFTLYKIHMWDLISFALERILMASEKSVNVFYGRLNLTTLNWNT